MAYDKPSSTITIPGRNGKTVSAAIEYVRLEIKTIVSTLRFKNLWTVWTLQWSILLLVQLKQKLEKFSNQKKLMNNIQGMITTKSGRLLKTT